MVQTFNRQALQMVWDFAEANPFSESTGNFLGAVEWIKKVINNYPGNVTGIVKQLDASSSVVSSNVVFITDPPYYDNIAYSDLSDYFYIWMRRTISKTYPDIFSTLLVPKEKEIIASDYRHGGDKDKSRDHFLINLRKAFQVIKDNMNDDYPFCLFYAFKQQETASEKGEENKISSTGWETMLQGLIDSGFTITGTWPIRTERPTGMKFSINALASSIIIVCRKKKHNSIISTRREFIKEVKNEIPHVLKNLKSSDIAPVDVAQSVIGPIMAIFSKYSKVLEADGTPMNVRSALQIINQELDSYLTEQESEMDKETRFCIAWYEQYGWKEGPFGDANTLANAKGTAINALEQSDVISAKAGKVRLLKRNELRTDWDPTTDKKLTVWECVQHLIRVLEVKGEIGAADALRKLGGLSEAVKDLTYRLYSLCEKKGWTEDGVSYNNLISSWQSISDRVQFDQKTSEETKKKIKDKSQKRLTDVLGGK